MKALIIFSCLFTITQVSNGQNVGIGTNTPIEKFTVRTNAGAYGFLHTDGTVSMGSWIGNDVAYFGTRSPHSLRFFINNNSNAPVMSLYINGNVGIGSSLPGYKLTVHTANNTSGFAQESDAGIVLNSHIGLVSASFGTLTNNTFHLRANNLTGISLVPVTDAVRVGIGNPSPEALLHVGLGTGARIAIGSQEFFEDFGSFTIAANGSIISVLDGSDDLGNTVHRWRNIYAVNGVINTSDMRQKKNIRIMPYGLNALMQLKPVAYNWLNDNNDDGAKLGLLAQDVLGVIPEVVKTMETTRSETVANANTSQPAAILGIYYADLVPVLIRSIQEQQSLIKSQEERIAALETVVEKLALKIK